ncbi:phosphatase PAP2 family protein [Glycomyces harbinensis]|uniref:Undecaprenyl-diphosphatase n=1 Tax=Glycomyces harbinensis TaxID=58114 RepID=A0A1G6SEF6_9ACTN|nr:phosphatase PAP2 family protein [Glycomyces harbinensis]SDD15133.1 undecaprenyl-diphosphatase [Glycomyces harbinensis]
MTPNRFPAPRWLLVLAIALPFGVLGDALWVRASGPAGPPWQGMDDGWNDLVGGSDSDLWWHLAELLNRLGAEPGLVVLAAGVVVLLLMRRWRSAVYTCAVVAATSLVIDVLKAVPNRARPDDIMVHTASWSFPSGHSARMAAFVVVIAVVAVPARRLRIWWPLAALLTLAMMWARTWQHAHWLSDTIAGAATGWAVAVFLWWALSPLLDRERALREAAAEPAGQTSGPGTERLS